MPKFSEIDVIAPFELDDDQKRRARDMVYGQGRIDHRSRVETRDRRCCEIAKIHILDALHGDVPGGHSQIDAFDHHRFPDQAFVYVETTDGEMIGWHDVQAETKSEHAMGLIFADDSGQGWLETWDHNGDPDPDQPLRRISLETPDTVDADGDFIRQNLPMDGEFYISREDLPVIVTIPWWGETMERSVIDAAKARLPAPEADPLAPEV